MRDFFTLVKNKIDSFFFEENIDKMVSSVFHYNYVHLNNAVSNDRAPVLWAEIWEQEDGGETWATSFGRRVFVEFVR